MLYELRWTQGLRFHLNTLQTVLCFIWIHCIRSYVSFEYIAYGLMFHLNTLQTVLCFIWIHCRRSYVSFEYIATFSDDSPNKILHIENGFLSADPVQIPGDETIEVDILILQPIAGHHYTLDLVMKKLGILDLKVPCVDNVGSWYVKQVISYLKKNIGKLYILTLRLFVLLKTVY